MCTHSRLIYNKYIRQAVRVDCGKCPACQQAKAVARSNRIRLNYSADTIPIFCTFTYSNDTIPYVYRHDLLHASDNMSVPLYRNVRLDHGGNLVNEQVLLDVIKLTPSDGFIQSSLRGLSKDKSRISFCYYPDIQLFFKRYRQILKRNYGVDPSFSYYACSEYGGKSQRAHFHALIFAPVKFAQTYKSAIAEAWPYGNYSAQSKLRAYEYVRKDAASYVASYVNCSNRLSSIFTSHDVHQKHSYSHGFGAASDTFSLRNILASIDSGDMSYVKQVCVDGASTFLHFPLPRYVVNRYFPKFKGFGRFAQAEIFSFVLDPYRLCKSRWLAELDYSMDDFLKFKTSVDNAYERFHAIIGLGRYDYAYYFSVVWQRLTLYVLKHSYDDIYSYDDWYDFYQNGNEVNIGVVRAPSLSMSLEEDANKCRFRVVKSNNLTLLYYKLDKQRYVTNSVMCDLDLAV